MSYGGPTSARRMTTGARPVPGSLAGWIATIAETIGLLNKGSARAPAAPGDVAEVQPISSNTLNVTRVGGVTALISAAGGAALVLFNVSKTKDRAPIVVAAYVSVGVIVAAALMAVAIIIAADIRARTAIATAVSPTLKADQSAVKQVQAVASAGAAGFVVSLDRAYDYVLVDAAAASTTLTLPWAGSAAWRQMTIIRQDTAGTLLTIRPQGSETISGQRERKISGAEQVHLYSNSREWLPIG